MSPWVDMGSAEVDDTPARMYQYKNMAGEKVNTYTFYISKVRSTSEGSFVTSGYFYRWACCLVLRGFVLLFVRGIGGLWCGCGCEVLESQLHALQIQA